MNSNKFIGWSKSLRTQRPPLYALVAHFPGEMHTTGALTVILLVFLNTALAALR